MKGLVEKLLIVAVLGILSGVGQEARAEFDCYRRVLNDFTVDSRSFQFYSESVTHLFEDKPELGAQASIELLEDHLNCSKKSLNPVEITCKEIVPGNYMSRVCYAENKNGYFFITLDLMENINLVFNRWD